MKKAIPALFVLAAVVAGAVFFFLRRDEQAMDMPPGRAAELAPADAVLFLEVPDVARTLERWKGTALYAISQEPEWREFTGKWEDFKTGSEMARELFGVFGDIGRADPAGLFLAMESLEGPMPKFVGGFPYRGKKSDVEAVVRQLREQLLKAFPAAKSEVVQMEGTEVELLTDTGFSMAMAFRDNWFLFASDGPGMDRLLKRYSGVLKTPPGLAADAVFAESRKHGQADADVVLWGRWSELGKQMNALAAMTGAQLPAVEDANPVQVVLYTGKLDGALMREQVYFHMKEVPRVGEFANRSLAFTNVATYAIGVATMEAMEDQIRAARQMMDAVGASTALDTQLAEKGLKMDDVFTTFGPEAAVMSAWEEGAVYPDLLVAVEVKDVGKALKFVELMAESDGPDSFLKTQTEGTTYWTYKHLAVGTIRPAFALNDKHLLFGLNVNVIKAGLAQIKSGGVNVATRMDSPYPGALKSVVAPGGGLMYVDTKVLFERLYDKAKPFLAFELVGSPELARYFDAAKLPQVETISKHLMPLVVSYGTAGRGWLIEGTGPVPTIGNYALTIPAVAFTFLRPGAMPVPVPQPLQTQPVPVAPEPPR